MGRPRTDIRHRVLVAARKRFLVDGVDGASLRTIARDAKTSVGMIYYYYPTKDALFLAAVEEVYAKLLATMESILGAEAPIKERLRLAYCRIGSATSEEIDVLRLVVREAILASPRFRQVLARFGQGHVALLVRALGEAAAHGEVDASIPIPLLTIAALAMGAVPQLARRVSTEDLPFASLPPVELLAEAAVEALFGGIGPKPARSRRTR